MELLGHIEGVTHTGDLIARGHNKPRPRTRVYSNRREQVGSVLRIFGPVDHPFITIRPSRGLNLVSLVSQKIYVEEKRNGTEHKRKRKPRRP